MPMATPQVPPLQGQVLLLVDVEQGMHGAMTPLVVLPPICFPGGIINISSPVSLGRRSLLLLLLLLLRCWCYNVRLRVLLLRGEWRDLIVGCSYTCHRLLHCNHKQGVDTQILHHRRGVHSNRSISNIRVSFFLPTQLGFVGVWCNIRVFFILPTQLRFFFLHGVHY